MVNISSNGSGVICSEYEKDALGRLTQDIITVSPTCLASFQTCQIHQTCDWFTEGSPVGTKGLVYPKFGLTRLGSSRFNCIFNSIYFLISSSYYYIYFVLIYLFFLFKDAAPCMGTTTMHT